MPTFDQIQQQFTAAIRDPDNNRMTGIEQRRMDVYRELIFNNVMNFTQSAFPVAHAIMPASWWQRAAQEFLLRHRSQSPYFNEIAAEFLAFLRESDAVNTREPDFLLELMHYEWVELAIDNIPRDTSLDQHELSGDLMKGKPVLSNAAWLLSYEYPVHEISPTNQPAPSGKRDTRLLVYRKPDLTVGFRLLNPVFALLWQQLQQRSTRSGQHAITELAAQLQIQPDPNFQQHAQQALDELYQCGAVLGAIANAPDQ